MGKEDFYKENAKKKNQRLFWPLEMHFVIFCRKPQVAKTNCWVFCKKKNAKNPLCWRATAIKVVATVTFPTRHGTARHGTALSCRLGPQTRATCLGVSHVPCRWTTQPTCHPYFPMASPYVRTYNSQQSWGKVLLMWTIDLSSQMHIIEEKHYYHHCCFVVAVYSRKLEK